MMALFQGRKETPRLATLRRLALFAPLSPLELRVVDGLLHERRYLKGEIVFDEGEEGQALYIVVEGQVLICRQSASGTQRIADAHAGAMFGELALLDGSPRAAQVRAAEDCVLAALSRADFNSLVETHGAIASKIALQLARELGQKLREHFVAMDERPL
jgi:CRP-like cAMP-binding protein